MGVHTEYNNLVITPEPKTFHFHLSKDVKQLKTSTIEWNTINYLSY